MKKSNSVGFAHLLGRGEEPSSSLFRVRAKRRQLSAHMPPSRKRSRESDLSSAAHLPPLAPVCISVSVMSGGSKDLARSMLRVPLMHAL